MESKNDEPTKIPLGFGTGVDGLLRVDPPIWTVWRQDDNANCFIVATSSLIPFSSTL